MIIDEPEAHLHPQWIVEYARLIVLLHKKLVLNFLLLVIVQIWLVPLDTLQKKKKVYLQYLFMLQKILLMILLCFII